MAEGESNTLWEYLESDMLRGYPDEHLWTPFDELYVGVKRAAAQSLAAWSLDSDRFFPKELVHAARWSMEGLVAWHETHYCSSQRSRKEFLYGNVLHMSAARMYSRFLHLPQSEGGILSFRSSLEYLQPIASGEAARNLTTAFGRGTVSPPVLRLKSLYPAVVAVNDGWHGDEERHRLPRRELTLVSCVPRELAIVRWQPTLALRSA